MNVRQLHAKEGNKSTLLSAPNTITLIKFLKPATTMLCTRIRARARTYGNIVSCTPGPGMECVLLSKGR